MAPTSSEGPAILTASYTLGGPPGHHFGDRLVAARWTLYLPPVNTMTAARAVPHIAFRSFCGNLLNDWGFLKEGWTRAFREGNAVLGDCPLTGGYDTVKIEGCSVSGMGAFFVSSTEGDT